MTPGPHLSLTTAMAEAIQGFLPAARRHPLLVALAEVEALALRVPDLERRLAYLERQLVSRDGSPSSSS